ncbi:uncharacterized protein B0T15DRAFT_4091 [Chaetomium strumarium]|uniref:Uncharacterized protein n=1 Tax=Chaetomium strumarium TaxID=1170767 RepID=A0AAJ0H0C4_9PEZI|nr:hypothetical protein B0T15DRAFT_4091 [Chaetomium strumarium]
MPRSYTYVYRWTCENCGLSDLNLSLDIACPNPHCAHARCRGCEVFTVKVLSEHPGKPPVTSPHYPRNDTKHNAAGMQARRLPSRLNPPSSTSQGPSSSTSAERRPRRDDDAKATSMPSRGISEFVHRSHLRRCVVESRNYTGEDEGTGGPIRDTVASCDSEERPMTTADSTHSFHSSGRQEASFSNCGSGPASNISMEGPNNSSTETSSPKAGGSPDDSVDSDLLSVSGCSGSTSLSDRSSLSERDLQLGGAIVHRLVSGHQAASNSASPGSGATAPTNSSAAPMLNSQASSSTSKGKRCLLDDNGLEDGASIKPPNRKRAMVGSGKRLKRIFACPYWKADPDRQRRCFTLILSRIKDVKQHLTRKHCPEFYCDRCSTIFPDDQRHRKHIDNPDGLFCRPSSVLDGLSHQQRSRLLRKADPKLSEEERWFAIWDIAFHGRARPCSAYRNADDSEELCSFHEYCHTHGPALLGSEIESMMQSGRWSGPELSADDIQRILRYVFEEAFDHMYGGWHSRASDAAQADTELVSGPQLTPPAVSSLPSLPTSGLATNAQLSSSHSQPEVQEQLVEASAGGIGPEGVSNDQTGPAWDDEQGFGSWDLYWGVD